LVISSHEVPWHDEPFSSGEDGESSEDDESSGEVGERGEGGDERFDSKAVGLRKELYPLVITNMAIENHNF